MPDKNFKIGQTSEWIATASHNRSIDFFKQTDLGSPRCIPAHPISLNTKSKIPHKPQQCFIPVYDPSPAVTIPAHPAPRHRNFKTKTPTAKLTNHPKTSSVHSSPTSSQTTLLPSTATQANTSSTAPRGMATSTSWSRATQAQARSGPRQTAP